jgi:hypothetical protein
MSLLEAVHNLLATACGGGAADDAIVEYMMETVRWADMDDCWQVCGYDSFSASVYWSDSGADAVCG